MLYHRNKTLTLVAVSTAQRSPLAPELPTVAESGIKDFDISIWWGMLAPAGTPSEILTRIHRDLVQIAEETEFRADLQKLGAVTVLSPPQAFATFLSEAVTKAAATAKQAGMKAE